jgi:hypothetical protein
MKRFGLVLVYVGVILVLVAGSWLKLVFAWWSTAATLCLIGLGAAIAATGGMLSKRGSVGVKDSGPKPPLT